jgi:hypothetical protein
MNEQNECISQTALHDEHQLLFLHHIMSGEYYLINGLCIFNDDDDDDDDYLVMIEYFITVYCTITLWLLLSLPQYR